MKFYYINSIWNSNSNLYFRYVVNIVIFIQKAAIKLASEIFE